MRTICIILGGGRGTRLHPLTQHRCKPAVPLAGKFRLIDIALSNCIHSNLRQMFVITQFNSASLNRHVAQTYRFDGFTDGFVEILAAEQTGDIGQWYQGPADAVRQNLRHVASTNYTHALILPGDALYRMDYSRMTQEHLLTGAEISIACREVAREHAPAFGIVRCDDNGRIYDHVEKPGSDQLDELMPVQRSDAAVPTWNASMGIYLFNRATLEQILSNESAHDFGHDIVPASLKQFNVRAHMFRGYWEDIGTIGAFYRANMALLEECPEFDFFAPDAPIFTRLRRLPSSVLHHTTLDRVMLAEGCRIRQATVRQSVLGLRTRIGQGSFVESSILMGADFYDDSEHQPFSVPASNVAVGIGQNCEIRGAIIDKNARIGDGTRIINAQHQDHADGPNYYIRNGIVIIPKFAVIAPGTVI